MKWFKHDSDASSDAKIKKLIIRHGAVGYAVYFHCIELITSSISENNLTFELEHDSEIIADNLKIIGDSTKSGMEIVENIMKTIEIMCDECGRDLTEIAGSVEYRLVWNSKKMEDKGFDIDGIKRFVTRSPFENTETEYHFCSKSCLKRWLK